MPPEHMYAAVEITEYKEEDAEMHDADGRDTNRRGPRGFVRQLEERLVEIARVEVGEIEHIQREPYAPRQCEQQQGGDNHLFDKVVEPRDAELQRLFVVGRDVLAFEFGRNARIQLPLFVAVHEVRQTEHCEQCRQQEIPEDKINQCGKHVSEERHAQRDHIDAKRNPTEYAVNLGGTALAPYAYVQLTQHGHEQHGREENVHQDVRYKSVAADDDDERQQDGGDIQYDAVMDFFGFDAHQQRAEDNHQQPEEPVDIVHAGAYVIASFPEVTEHQEIQDGTHQHGEQRQGSLRDIVLEAGEAPQEPQHPKQHQPREEECHQLYETGHDEERFFRAAGDTVEEVFFVILLHRFVQRIKIVLVVQVALHSVPVAAEAGDDVQVRRLSVQIDVLVQLRIALFGVIIGLLCAQIGLHVVGAVYHHRVAPVGIHTQQLRGVENTRVAVLLAFVIQHKRR